WHVPAPSFSPQYGAKTMKQFHVTWTIDIDANNRQEAARRVLAIQRDPASIATVFEVKDDKGKVVEIELSRSGIEKVMDADTKRDWEDADRHGSEWTIHNGIVYLHVYSDGMLKAVVKAKVLEEREYPSDREPVWQCDSDE